MKKRHLQNREIEQSLVLYFTLNFSYPIIELTLIKSQEA